MIQLDFFEEDTDIKEVKERVKNVESSSDRVRKALFARHGELAKICLDLMNRLDILEQNICKGK